jgi:hypothetical protein
MKIQVRGYHIILIATAGRAAQRFQQAMSSRAKSRDLTNAGGVTQVGEVLRCAQDDTTFFVSVTQRRS